MSPRLKLANEAKTLSRRIFASLPFNVRAAASISQIVKLAFGSDASTMGYAALKLMADAGVQGVLFRGGKDMDEVRELLSQKKLAPLSRVIDQLGRTLLGPMSKLDDETRDMVVDRLLTQFLSGSVPLKAVNIPQAMHYLNLKVKGVIKDIVELRLKRPRQERSEKLDLSQLSGSPLLRSIPTKVWQEVLRRLGNDPDFLGPEGEPRMRIILDGLMDGRPLNDIATNELDMEYKALYKWFQKPGRQKKLRQVLAPLQDYFEMLQQ